MQSISPGFSIVNKLIENPRYQTQLPDKNVIQTAISMQKSTKGCPCAFCKNCKHKKYRFGHPDGDRNGMYTGTICPSLAIFIEYLSLTPDLERDVSHLTLKWQISDRLALKALYYVAYCRFKRTKAPCLLRGTAWQPCFAYRLAVAEKTAATAETGIRSLTPCGRMSWLVGALCTFSLMDVLC